jgi:hypothetical protein
MEALSDRDDSWHECAVLRTCEGSGVGGCEEEDTVLVEYVEEDMPSSRREQMCGIPECVPNARVRSASEQLQDEECYLARVGENVLALASTKDEDGGEQGLWHDAVIQHISRHRHRSGVCPCQFTLRWLHGPRKGEACTVGIDAVCLVCARTIYSTPEMTKKGVG